MTKPPIKTAAVIVAAGSGTRAGGPIAKQWQIICGRRVIDWTIEAFQTHPDIHQIIVVTSQDTASEIGSGFEVAIGGSSRSLSVQAGLDLLADDIDTVLIHDGARPCVSHAVIDRVLNARNTHKAAAPAIAVTDALWRGKNGEVTGTQDRTGLWRAQTPQCFQRAAISAAHVAYEGSAADDVEVARAAGLDVAIVEGDIRNIKITTPSDFARAEMYLRDGMGGDMNGNATQLDVRTGNGFDVHRFGPGDNVMLCGVRIAHSRGLQGHSDADVGLHTITDAIYGALAEGDIGQHFPPSDPQWKGVESHVFLRHAVALSAQMGFAITHVDCTLICEEPKIGPHAAVMRDKLAELIEITRDRISVKATTSEQLGFTGRREGIACMATATLIKL